MRVCYDVMRRQDLVFGMYDDNVTCVGFGDDHLLSVSDSAHNFNYRSLQSTMATYGLKYTDETKSTVLPEFKKLEDVTFLKRGFALEDGMFLAPLDYNVIRQQPYHFKKGADEFARVKENCECALKELSLYAPEVFDDYAKRLCSEALTCGISLIPDQDYYNQALKREWLYVDELEYLNKLLPSFNTNDTDEEEAPGCNLVEESC